MTPRRRHGDRTLMREHWYRDVWLLIMTGLVVWALWLNHQTLHQQAKGRRFAIGVTCAALSAVSESGRQVIVGGSGGVTGRFEQALEHLGYPPRPVRREQANEAARLYVERISLDVQRQVGGRGRQLIRPDGTIDCQQLQRLANTIASK